MVLVRSVATVQWTFLFLLGSVIFLRFVVLTIPGRDWLHLPLGAGGLSELSYSKLGMEAAIFCP